MSSIEISFVTTNERKFSILSGLLVQHNIKLTHKKLETPEIQDEDLSKVAKFSADWAAKKIGETILVNDFGYGIEGINGFPGAFSKYVLKWFNQNDWLRLLKGLENRTMTITWAYALGFPDKEPVSIQFSSGGKLLNIPGKEGLNTLHQLFIPEGFDRPFSELSQSDQDMFWGKSFDHERLSQFIQQSILLQ